MFSRESFLGGFQPSGYSRFMVWRWASHSCGAGSRAMGLWEEVRWVVCFEEEGVGRISSMGWRGSDEGSSVSLSNGDLARVEYE